MKKVEGDLIQMALDGHFDVIIHGCNCFCTMGAGIARQIQNAFPEAYRADCQTGKGDIDKLGTYSWASVERAGHRFVVVNAYTQYGFGGSRANVDYDAIGRVMREIRSRFDGKRIGYPKIGAGLGGGDWPTIERLIDDRLSGQDHTLVVYRPEPRAQFRTRRPRIR